MAQIAVTMKDYKVETFPTWCPGCGDFSVLAGITKALATAGKHPNDVAVVSGIGCSSNLPHFLKAYGIHSLHGRALPVAQGIKLANPDMVVIATGGDGDGYGIGAGHFIHAARRNVDLTYIVMDNAIYGLTKGQVSPTSQLGFVTATTPHGNHEAPVNPLALFLASGGSFLAQGFSGDMKGLTAMYEDAIKHPGFALVNTFSPCVTFNKVQTYQFYRDALVTIDGQKVQHDPTNKAAAMQRVIDGNIYNGILYREVRPTPESQLKALQGVDSLVGLDLTKGDYGPIIESYR